MCFAKCIALTDRRQQEWKMYNKDKKTCMWQVDKSTLLQIGHRISSTPNIKQPR
jgi:hypothetical protein